MTPGHLEETSRALPFTPDNFEAPENTQTSYLKVSAAPSLPCPRPPPLQE